MKNFDTYYVIVFSISLLLILLTLMQYKEYPVKSIILCKILYNVLPVSH